MGKSTDIHEDFDRSETIKPRSDRDFGLVFAASFLVLPVLSCRAAGHHWPWWLDTAAVTLAIAMTRPALPAPLEYSGPSSVSCCSDSLARSRGIGRERLRQLEAALTDISGVAKADPNNSTFLANRADLPKQMAAAK
jgi:hypothetical protein